MLEQYFIRPETADRIRGSWLGCEIEKYVIWLSKHAYKARCVHRRVPLLLAFGTFAQKRGAGRIEHLACHIDAFVRSRLRSRVGPCRSKAARQVYFRDIRGPIEQFLRVVQFDEAKPAVVSRPFKQLAPGFFAHLRDERGLSPVTVTSYEQQLVLFERFVAKRGVVDPRALSVAVLDAFCAERRTRVSPRSLGTTRAALRAFLKYLFREGMVRRDLSATVEGPRTYPLSGIPRSISADDVQRMLEAVDRRSIVGKRDFAMLQLLAVYGLRAREVAMLTLDDLDWKAGVLHVRARKAGHSGVYPLVTAVGEAVLDYLRHGRPETEDRRIFFCSMAPQVPVTYRIVSSRAKFYLRKAGIDVARPGSHTLRHSCAQRLVDAEFSLKVIGDFLGHRRASSTRVYSKVAIEALREVALGDGEEVL